MLREFYLTSNCEIMYKDINCSCNDGACLNEGSCKDYDGGKEPYIASHTYGKGTAGYFVDSYDECFTDSAGTVRVVEYTCKDNTNLQAWSIECPNGCSNGACIQETQCNETDDGYDPDDSQKSH